MRDLARRFYSCLMMTASDLFDGAGILLSPSANLGNVWFFMLDVPTYGVLDSATLMQANCELPYRGAASQTCVNILTRFDPLKQA
ncbi:hypothetical protein DAEQUDRAFT_309586 [Daedalea quercina L-15889]|uniref:Uncharacterized protein n=1 Tax=Daedalea quercina L-15889 TaxID=1314783 RepID=A0A165PYG8_9APHY|nr:hypothetical protein DAEQUDRAFT_309586 [Daedalea quercina L-15889]